jgi:hypothetical protein
MSYGSVLVGVTDEQCRIHGRVVKRDGSVLSFKKGVNKQAFD